MRGIVSLQREGREESLVAASETPCGRRGDMRRGSQIRMRRHDLR